MATILLAPSNKPDIDRAAGLVNLVSHNARGIMPASMRNHQATSPLDWLIRLIAEIEVERYVRETAGQADEGSEGDEGCNLRAL
jgi:hypothetical protein